MLRQLRVDIILINKIMIGFQHFSQFSKKLKQIPLLPSILDQYEDTYNLRRYRISQISISEAEKIYQNIERKFYKYYHKSESGAWFENELKIFVWLLVCYIESNKRQVRQFNEDDWGFFQRIFYVKHQVLFQYQAKITLDYSLCLQKWSREQDEMLSKIVSGVLKIKWSDIAKSLFTNSERKYVRTSKQCRERWLNHLDPSKTKLNWSLEECKLLLKSVLEKGKKWASLVQMLGGRRSQHSIKNKYNSMLIKQSKLTPHQNEDENCQSLLSELESAMACPEMSMSGSCILRDGEASSVKQQMAIRQQQNQLYKSNSSLATTQNINGRSDNQMSLNLDDLWLVETDRGQQSGCESRASRGKGKRHKQLGSSQQVCQLDVWDLDGGMESFVSLHEIQLVLRESELDR